MIHKLQPGCMVANNHHQPPFPGEDIQIFERDLPGENTAGLSGQAVSRLPLETCNTMNGMWGYKINDQNYKDATTLIRYLVKAAGMGANLLLNIGPQPSGDLPATALSRLKEMGEWMRENGETIYGTEAGPFPAQSWGTTTRKGNRLFVHVMTPETSAIILPGNLKIKKAFEYKSKKPVSFSRQGEHTLLQFDSIPTGIDYIIECSL